MTPAIRELEKLKIPYRLNEYTPDKTQRGFGEAAALALGHDPKQVFKTLMAIVDADQRRPAIAIVPVSGSLDLKKLAAALGGRKAEMADPAYAEKRSGYVVGGISPLGQKNRHRTLIDESAMNFDTIYVSAGKRGLELALSPTDLQKLTEADFVKLAR